MITAKHLLRIWTINALLCVLSLYLYRFYSPNKTFDDENLLAKFFNFGIDLLKIYWTTIFFIGMVFLSLTILLNLNKAIITNRFLSLLSFLLIPIALIVYLFLEAVFSGDFVVVFSFLTDWLIPPFIYLLFTSAQFYFFRKRYNRLKTNSKNQMM